MKKISVVCVLSLVFLLHYDPSVSRAQSSSKTMVYYFHGQFRCQSCMRIERLTRAALEKGFRKELASGAVAFRAVNVDEPKNEHYAAEYSLNTRSVVVSNIKAGKEMSWKNLNKVWDYLGNENEFENYIIGEVRGFTRQQ